MMPPNFDLKFYLAVFRRRLPWFLGIAGALALVGIVTAIILPPVYRSQASMLVEPQQIPGALAQSTVPVNPYEQAQIIEQRIMTRANLLELANSIGLYAGRPDMTASQMVGDIRRRITFLGFTPDDTRALQTPGAMIIGVAFEAPTPQHALSGTNELVSLVLREDVRLRTGSAVETVEFFDAEVARLSADLERQAQRISEFKTSTVDSLPDSLATRRAQQQREQERLLALEREEAALRNQRSTVVWVFERTGRASSMGMRSQEEQDLEAMKSQLSQQRTIYAPGSPTIRMLENRIAALEGLVAEQRAQRAVPDADGNAAAPVSELDVELAPIDARLEYIAEEKALIQGILAQLDSSIQSTPANEMVLAGLEREYVNLQRQYDEAMGRRGQAAVGERIEVLSKGERFTLIEAPTAPGGPVKPRRSLIAAAGIMGGLGAGFAFVALLELLNRSIRRPADVSAGLGMQPFATVPYIYTKRELRWRRNSVAMALGVVFIGLPGLLLAVHLLYQPLDVLITDVRASLAS